MRHFETEISLIKGLVDRGKPVTCKLTGDSMFPLFHDGDEVVVEQVEQSKVRPGDVLAYQYGKWIVAHVVHFSLSAGNRSLLLLKGIANDHGDRPVNWDKVIGRVTHVKRNGRLQPVESFKINPLSALAWRCFLQPGVLYRGLKGVLR